MAETQHDEDRDIQRNLSNEEVVRDTTILDLEELFAAVMNAKSKPGSRVLHVPFLLLPRKPGQPTDMMNLKTIATVIKNGCYLSLQQLEDDLKDMFDNVLNSYKQSSQIYKDAVTLSDIVKTKMKELQNKGSRSSRRPRCHRFIEQVANLTYSDKKDARAPKRVKASKGKNGGDRGTGAEQSAKRGRVNEVEKNVKKEVQEDKVKLKFSDLHIGSLEVEMPIQQAMGPVFSALLAAAKPAVK